MRLLLLTGHSHSPVMLLQIPMAAPTSGGDSQVDGQSMLKRRVNSHKVLKYATEDIRNSKVSMGSGKHSQFRDTEIKCCEKLKNSNQGNRQRGTGQCTVMHLMNYTSTNPRRPRSVQSFGLHKGR